MDAITDTAAGTRPYYPRPAATDRERRRGPYSKHLGRLDRRFRLGRAAAAFEAELTAHVGGNPSAPQMSLIRMATLLWTRLELMRERMLSGEDIDERAMCQTLAWVNSLERALRQLPKGVAAAETAPTLADYLASKAKTTPQTAPQPPTTAPAPLAGITAERAQAGATAAAWAAMDADRVDGPAAARAASDFAEGPP